MTFGTLLDDGSVAVGTMLSEVRNPNIATMMRTAGLDFFIIDMEHGTYGWPEMAALIAVARACGLEPIVRVPEIRRETIIKPLDAGASGLLVPMVERPEQAEQVVYHAKYPPLGHRGAALRRAHSRYRKAPAAEYLRDANAFTYLMVQIETQSALDAVEQISAIPGIDALFIGPFDLSVSLGVPGESSHPRLRDAYQKIIGATSRAGLSTGMQFMNLDEAETMIAEGINIVSFSSDVNMLVDQAASAAENIRTFRRPPTIARPHTASGS